MSWGDIYLITIKITYTPLACSPPTPYSWLFAEEVARNTLRVHGQWEQTGKDHTEVGRWISCKWQYDLSSDLKWWYDFVRSIIVTRSGICKTLWNHTESWVGLSWGGLSSQGKQLVWKQWQPECGWADLGIGFRRSAGKTQLANRGIYGPYR